MNVSDFITEITRGADISKLETLWQLLGKGDPVLQEKLLLPPQCDVLSSTMRYGYEHAKEVVEFLWEKAGTLPEANRVRCKLISRDNYKPFAISCEYDYKEIGDYLWEKASELPAPDGTHRFMLTAGQKAAFRWSIDYSRADIVEGFFEKAFSLPEGEKLVEELLRHSNFYALRRASQCGSAPTAEHVWNAAAALPCGDELKRRSFTVFMNEDAATAGSPEAATLMLKYAYELGGEDVQRQLLESVADGNNERSIENYGKALYPDLEKACAEGTQGLKEAFAEIPEALREHIPDQQRLRLTAQQQDVINSPYKGRG